MYKIDQKWHKDLQKQKQKTTTTTKTNKQKNKQKNKTNAALFYFLLIKNIGQM